MSALLILLTLAARVVLAGVIIGAISFVVWALLDCTLGDSAALAAEVRRRARREVAGR
ncbi:MULTISPECIES: hypothetical protein [Brachybacterium]|uniref:Uncharacterized protein n=1 Tax=Brachybacterium conglomeratum TaxID=47846 RepID=A0ABQ5RGU8_9MICO|nr:MULTISPECIES: hypothetical protein [Brachybacterium]GLI30391.1 hypothetical protein BCONGLO52_12320 [Brachybacterium conglomeratum]GLK04930.1 hypothetical protein GCM10017597_17300 [Brachybacterium conglomeratum]